MNSIDQIERITQKRVVKLLSQQLGYDYLGDWQDRTNNRNIETKYLTAFLQQQGHNHALINKAIYEFEKTASDQTLNLANRNKAVYQLLRYGVKVKADISENTQTVWLIDWKNQTNNHFAFAEEVTVKGANAKANSKRPDRERDIGAPQPYAQVGRGVQHRSGVGGADVVQQRCAVFHNQHTVTVICCSAV